MRSHDRIAMKPNKVRWSIDGRLYLKNFQNYRQLLLDVHSLIDRWPLILFETRWKQSTAFAATGCSYWYLRPGASRRWPNRWNIRWFSSTKGGTICINRGWVGFSKSSEKSSRSLAFFPSSMFIARYGWMTQLGDQFQRSRQIGTNLHLNGFLEWVLLVLTTIVIQSCAKYNGSLT